MAFETQISFELRAPWVRQSTRKEETWPTMYRDLSDAVTQELTELHVFEKSPHTSFDIHDDRDDLEWEPDEHWDIDDDWDDDEDEDEDDEDKDEDEDEDDDDDDDEDEDEDDEDEDEDEDDEIRKELMELVQMIKETEDETLVETLCEMDEDDRYLILTIRDYDPRHHQTIRHQIWNVFKVVADSEDYNDDGEDNDTSDGPQTPSGDLLLV